MLQKFDKNNMYKLEKYTSKYTSNPNNSVYKKKYNQYSDEFFSFLDKRNNAYLSRIKFRGGTGDDSIISAFNSQIRGIIADLDKAKTVPRYGSTQSDGNLDPLLDKLKAFLQTTYNTCLTDILDAQRKYNDILIKHSENLVNNDAINQKITEINEALPEELRGSITKDVISNMEKRNTELFEKIGLRNSQIGREFEDIAGGGGGKLWRNYDQV